MEWIIGLVVIWLFWRLLTGKTRREETVKDAIGKAFIASSKLGRQWIDTPIYWEAAEKFANERGARINNDGAPSAHFDMRINGEDVSVILMRDRTNGTTQISARRTEDVINEGNEFIKNILKK